MINLNQSFLKEAMREADQSSAAILSNAERIESSLKARVGNVTKSKRMTDMLIPGVLIVITAFLVLKAWTMPLIMDPAIGKVIFCTAGITTGLYLAFQILSLMSNDSFYKEAFEGLEKIRGIKSAVEEYRKNMNGRRLILESIGNDGRNHQIHYGRNYLVELEQIEYRGSSLHDTRKRSYDRITTMAYYGAAFSVAAAEIILLQPMMVELLNELIGHGQTIYMICGIISVIGGPLLGTYYLHTCRGIPFNTSAYLWIMLDGLFGLLLCAIVVAVVALAIGIVVFVLQLVMYVVGLVIGLFILYSICSGA